jgi:ethanolamine utilization protein EutN
MNLGRVIGTVVATQKYAGLTGCKLLLVQPLDHAQRKAGDYLVAVDTVRAGFGELIYFVNSREAALALEPSFVPVDAAIVGIVDEVAADPLPAIDDEVFFRAGRPAQPAKDPVTQVAATAANGATTPAPAASVAPAARVASAKPALAQNVPAKPTAAKPAAKAPRRRP